MYAYYCVYIRIYIYTHTYIYLGTTCVLNLGLLNQNL